MRLLDRYVLQNFLIPFLYSTLGFLAIWLVFDLSGNGHEFIDAHVRPAKLAYFYLTQFPQILIIALPVGLLLALLYSLSRMSRSNEIISMLTAGVSVLRVMLPLFIFGFITAGFSLALNYALAPHSDQTRKLLLDEIARGHAKSGEIDQQLFRNRQDARTWFVESIPNKQGNQLNGIDITQQDADGNVITKWFADRAVYDPATRTWTLSRGKQVNFDNDGNIISEDDSWLVGSKRIKGWSETVWRIASSNEDPADLSVPELREYLTKNADFPHVRLAPFWTHFWYRWAVPFQCLVVIFIAAPLGIVYSRRGILGGIAGCIFIYFAMGFMEKLFLALGKGDRMPAILAAWGSDLVFIFVGCYLLWLRANNREFPRLRLPWLR
jgi:LPS export ABC transporter permease LptG